MVPAHERSTTDATNHARAGPTNAGRCPAPLCRRGQRPAGPGRPVRGRHRRVVHPVRGGRRGPVDLRRVADAAPAGRPARAWRARCSTSSRPCRATRRRRAWRPCATREVRVMGGDLEGTLPDVRERYLAAGIRTICYVPIVFGDETLGLLVLYHTTDYNWTADETELARAFADHMATAISNARLAEFDQDAGRAPAGDLRAGRPPEPPPGRPRRRPGDRRRGATADRLRHDPGLPRRPRDRDVRADRLPRHVPGLVGAGHGDAARPDRQGPDRLGGGARQDDPPGRRRERPADPEPRRRATGPSRRCSCR